MDGRLVECLVEWLHRERAHDVRRGRLDLCTTRALVHGRLLIGEGDTVIIEHMCLVNSLALETTEEAMSVEAPLTSLRARHTLYHTAGTCR